MDQVIAVKDDIIYYMDSCGTMKRYRLILPKTVGRLRIISRHICYFLKSLSQPWRFYFGYTVDIDRRIRQHNGEIKGGAKRTRKGRPWKVVCYISGFPDQTTALQFEWRLHHPLTKKKSKKGVERALDIITEVISMDQWTSNSIMSSDIHLTIHWYESGNYLKFVPLNVSQIYI